MPTPLACMLPCTHFVKVIGWTEIMILLELPQIESRAAYVLLTSVYVIESIA